MSQLSTPKQSDTPKRRAEVAISPLENTQIKKFNTGEIMDAAVLEVPDNIDPQVSTYINLAIARAISAMEAKYEEKLLGMSKLNNSLEEKVNNLEQRVYSLEKSNDSLEQYSRRNNIRITGIEYAEGENVEQKVMDLVSKGDVDLNINDIDRAHRVGTKQDVLVKFVTYRKKAEVMLAKKEIHAKEETAFIAEDLTRIRSNMLYEARKLKRANIVKHVWTSDGTIIIRSFNNHKRKIFDIKDLDFYK